MLGKHTSATVCDFIRLITIQIDILNKKKEKDASDLEKKEELQKLKDECQLFYTKYYIVK